ncbi:MAG TPA: hypothetical protein VM120_29695 [Bryobacteraceae bacterium]|nr:hypothetical protein [Bryobacteraceae bacterium]
MNHLKEIRPEATFLLIGGSLANAVPGYATTLPVTMEKALQPRQRTVAPDGVRNAIRGNEGSGNTALELPGLRAASVR